MRNLKYYFLLVSLLILMCNCTNTSTPLQVKEENIHKGKLKNILEMVGPVRHYYKFTPDKCYFPAYDCFQTIVVIPSNAIYINELDSRIVNNSVDSFFQSNGNYQFLFPGFTGPAYTDLKNNVTTLRKGFETDSSIFYHIIYLNDTNSVPNYSQYY